MQFHSLLYHGTTFDSWKRFQKLRFSVEASILLSLRPQKFKLLYTYVTT